ncbi:MAG: HEAT repeat domain-containing protein [Elusimicrobia bacterium]|nr:HEAT repeat domain-containing protein [Elusimicrobiota bacterium]
MSADGEFLGCGRRWSAACAPGVQAALLGKAPKYAPDRDFDSLHVKLDLNVDLRRRVLSGTCATTVRARRPGVRRLEFDAVDLQVSRVEVDGRPARFRLAGGKLRVSLPRALAQDAETRVLARYRVREPKTGVHFTAGGGQMWSQSQPEDARRWFPCQDAPHAKATSEVRARVPAGFRAVSNGVLVEHEARGGRETWHWRMDRPHSIYLITLAVGRFSEIQQDWDGIPVVFYCEKGREADARRGLGKTAKALAFFSAVTGVRYPYPRYAQVAVAEYPGGMEHTTCTTQTDACLIDARASKDHDLDLLVAHELAHQWFGDLVTCTEWPHAWLNEGFATYFEVLFQAHDKGQDEADYELLANARAYFDEESRRYRRPIVCRTYLDPWTIFDRHLYDKGSWVVHMLRRELGEAPWRKAIGHYLRKHRDATVETQDLAAAVEESTGRNLQPFFDQWIYRAGHPVLRARWSYDAKTKKGSLWLLQTQPVDESSPAFRFPVDIRLVGRGWTRDFKERMTDKEHRFAWRLPGEPLNIELDPDFVLLKKLTLAKPVPMWLHQLARGRKAVSRALAAEPVARWGGEKAVAALQAQIRRERFWGAAVEMIRALGAINGRSADRALEGLLDRPHPKALRAVVAEIGRRAQSSAARLLAPLARRHAFLGVQAEATRQLGGLGSPSHLSIAERNLKTASYRGVLAASAVSALSAARDPRRIPQLKSKASAGAPFAPRAAALRALAEHAAHDTTLVPWLCGHAEDRDERVTLVALAALGSTEDERALPFLDRLAKSAANPRVRVHAAEAAARVKAGGSKASL